MNRIVPFLFIVLLAVSAAAAQQRIMFQHLTVKDGLSQGGVTCVLQDRRGFMWFGTQDGLNRYDGYQFTVFKHDPEDSTTLSDNWILALAEDSSGTLWVRTMHSDSLWDRYDPASESFSVKPRRTVRLETARMNSVKADVVEPSGVRWTGSIGGGVTRFEPATGQTTLYRRDPANPRSLVDDRVYSIYRDRVGTIWIGTREGLERFEPRTGEFVHYRHEPANRNSLSDNWVWPILEDRDGILWVGTFRGGLNRFDRATGTFTRMRHEDTDPRSLAGDQLYSLYQDESGMIWVGTNDNGVDRFHPDLQAFSHFSSNPQDNSSLIDDNVLSMYVDRAGVAWIGTRSGVERFDRVTGTFQHYRHDPANRNSIGDNQVQCFLQDRDGTLWMGMVSSGLERFDQKTGRFTRYRNNPSDAATLSDNRVYALLEDRSGIIWVGTYGGGLNRFDRRTGQFQRYVHDKTDSRSLGAPGVFALAEDHQGALWVGTFGGGLDRFDPDTKTFTHFKRDDANPGSISDDIIACLHVDRRGTLWVGTTQGLNRFDRQTGMFKRYREKEGLANDVVFGILEDESGNLWMSTNKGLSRFDPEAERFKNFTYEDGLQGDEFNQNAFARDPVRGELYFGGSNGFNVFHPRNVRTNAFQPPVVFSSFTRYNTDDLEGKPIRERGISVKDGIVLSYKDNVANFEFAALNFYNTFKNRYAYKLEGYSDNWIQLGTDRRATFTNLDGGDYVLRVRGSNNDGVWNEVGASLAITVDPPWWKTKWAYGTYFVLVVGFLYGARRFEMNQREQKAKMREAELHAKAADAENRALQAENERKTKELEDARRLQLSLLPKDVPRLPEYDIAVFMKTATEVGGDYYDFSTGEDKTLNVAFGDATGHGMQAGTIVTLMKGLFLSDASRFDIQTFFNHCSRAIKEIRLGRLFMAFTLVRLKGKSVSFSSAGMPPVYIHRKSDGTVEEILLKGMPLGAMKNFPYGLHETELHDGDTLLLLSDGLPEQKNTAEEMFDYARLQKEFVAAADRTPEEIITHLVQAGDAWMNGAVQDDDISLLVVRKKP